MMGFERTALPTSWGWIGSELLNLTVPRWAFEYFDQTGRSGVGEFLNL